MIIELRKTYKFRLYENDANVHLHQQIDVAGLVGIKCDSCGVVLARDHNAALNIKRVGASTLSETV
ncbi:MAG: hypothetical protein CUN55_14045 [Phototrophicales bacterium]|nr:MAG: hypothetical protein CUN55_14045 [Phototrophicales bacterium]